MDLDHIHVEVHGHASGPTIVLVHGAPDRSGSFRSLLPQLSDLRVVVYDRRGYGRSVHARPPTGMQDHAEDLLAILDRFPLPRVVVAHSFGSNVTMLAATMKPDAFSAVGLWEPPLIWLDWWPQQYKDFNQRVVSATDPAEAIEGTYVEILGESTWRRLPKATRARRRAEGVAFQVDMASEQVAPFAFGDVDVPALVGYGTGSDPEYAESSACLARQLPQARLLVVQGAAHFAHQTHPEDYAAFTRSTLALALDA